LYFFFYLKNAKEKDKLLVTGRLPSELCSNNLQSVWKTLKKEFKGKDRTATVNGLRNDDYIANLFAESIKKNLYSKF